MDVKTSRKEVRSQPNGASVEVLMDNITDLYPVFDDYDEYLITDLEMLTDSRLELLDRAMFSVMEQRGGDPLDATDGVQIEETILGEISVIVLMTQMMAAVMAEGPGVTISYDSYVSDGKEYLTVALNLVPAA